MVDIHSAQWSSIPCSIGVLDTLKQGQLIFTPGVHGLGNLRVRRDLCTTFVPLWMDPIHNCRLVKKSQWKRVIIGYWRIRRWRKTALIFMLIAQGSQQVLGLVWVGSSIIITCFTKTFTLTYYYAYFVNRSGTSTSILHTYVHIRPYLYPYNFTYTHAQKPVLNDLLTLAGKLFLIATSHLIL